MSWLTRIFGKSSSLPVAEMGRIEQAERRRNNKSSQASGSSEGLDPSHTRRRSDRAIQRDLIHAIVREAIVGLGVLSSHFKFKVLSVDQEGSQFLVMVDVSEQVSPGMNKLALVEAMIVQRALSQRKLRITAVYWRVVPEEALRPASQSAPTRTASASQNSAAPHHRAPALAPRQSAADPDAQRDKPLGGTQYGELR